jgi:hypothetical protein
MLGRRLHRRHGHSGLRAFRTDWARRFARQADGWHFGFGRTAMSIFTSNTMTRKHMTRKHMTRKHMTRKHMTRKHMTRKHVLAGCALAILAYGACTLGPAIGAETVPNFAPDSNVGWVASWPSTSCLASSALTMLFCLDTLFARPPSCPAFPRTGFARPSSRGPRTRPQRYSAGSDSSPARTRPRGLSVPFACLPGIPPPTTLCSPTIACLSPRVAGWSLAGQTSPSMSRLASARR